MAPVVSFLPRFAALLLPVLAFVRGTRAFSASLATRSSPSSSKSSSLKSQSSALRAADGRLGGGGSLPSLPDVRAAVIVPGFLTGRDEFLPLAESLNDAGVPAVVVPMPNWHWLPCLGGRSMRPMLERIDFAVRHLAGVAGDLDAFERTTSEGVEKSLEEAMAMAKQGLTTGSDSRDGRPTTTDPQLLLPDFSYSLVDCYRDFRNNPGGVLEVGGTSEVDSYPLWTPKGSFPTAPEPAGRVALIGHSAGGWICRAYLSDRDYGGRSYSGHELVHSLVTLGSPHGNAPGAAFKGVEWVNRPDPGSAGVRALAVGGTGYPGDSSGTLTQNAYSFCCQEGSDGSGYDGDGVTPIQSALAMKDHAPGTETLVLDDVGHFCWSDVFGGDIVAPELAEYHREGRPWYGDEGVIEKWAGWLF